MEKAETTHEGYPESCQATHTRRGLVCLSDNIMRVTGKLKLLDTRV